MSEFLEFYQKQVSRGLSSIPWLSHLQTQALEDFTQLGFPNRHQEEWKYSSVESFIKQRFIPMPQVVPDDAFKQNKVPVGQSISYENGQWVNLEALILPPGVKIQSLAQAYGKHSQSIEAYLGRILPHEHGFQALNTAMLQQGLFIYVPEGVHVDIPLVISHQQSHALQAAYIRHLVIAQKNSSICLIEDYRGVEDKDYFTNAMTEIMAEKGSRVCHYKIQREGKLAYHTSHLAIRQAEKSSVESHLISLGGRWVRSDVTIQMLGREAACFLNGVYAPNDGQHMDHHTLVHHSVPHCRSEQDYKGILNGHSRAVFNGKVLVAQDAQKTEARQQNKNLLLSTKAEIDTKPQLEIFADDVICTHGATVGQLEEDALFYFASRGIETAEAMRYLLRAFAANNLKRMNDATLSQWISTLLDKQLGHLS